MSHSIPVMFDVSFTANREDAAHLLAEALAEVGLTRWIPGGVAVPGLRPPIESWWLIEGQDKHADRNDNDAGIVVFDNPDVLH